MAIITTLSVRETNPSGTFEPPPKQARFHFAVLDKNSFINADRAYGSD
jgi:hypothetical protein